MLGLILWKQKLMRTATGTAGLAGAGHAGLSHRASHRALADQRYSYGADQKFSPTAMLLTGGIVALVGLGLMSMNAEAIKKHIIIIDGSNIPVPPPPQPKEKPVEIKKVEHQPKTNVTVVKPVTDVKPLTDSMVKPYDPGPVPFTPTIGKDLDPAPYVPPPTPMPPVAADPVITKVMRDPKYARAFQPDYPAAMQRLEKEGRVSVKVLVGTDGRVKQVEILSATDPAFAEATRRQAMGSWRFKPATRDGVAQEEWFTTSVVFRLDQA